MHLPDSPAAQTILGRPVEENPASDQVFSQIHSWLDDCIDNHKRCADIADATVPLPTRVLDVGTLSSDTICLRDSDTKSESCGRYIALSHCWGTEKALVTTSKSLANRKQGIPVNAMPRTFRDAVLITRRLGLRYIWIDSFCILQDDV